MTKKILSALLASVMVVSCAAFTANAADEKVYYVEAGATGGDGSEDEPFGTIDEAILELDGKDGTICVIGEYELSTFKAPKWEGTVTVKGYDEDTVLKIAKSMGVVCNGDIIFKDVAFEAGQNSHINPQGTKLVMDGGEGSEFNSFLHLSTFGNVVVDEADFVMESGYVHTLHAAGSYCTSLANGVMGDSDITINGGKVANLNISADKYMENHTGISIGGNLNIVINGGEIGAIKYNKATPPEVMGALNIVFNNGMEAPESFAYNEATIAGGVFIIKSAEGGMVTPVADALGQFQLKADKGMIAVIDGEQIPDGVVDLEPGETEVTWVEGEQAEAEEPIEIKLTIDSKEIVVNGKASELDVPAQIVDSRTLVPLRAIFEALGASVEWNGETSTVTSAKGDTSVKLTIGENKIYVNDEAKELDVAAQIIESRTMVPARAVAEAYGCNVAWDGDTRTVIITK